jgi:hypothetical protein
MIHFARATMLVAALAACAPDARTPAERRAAAARADSSAAGYDVGVSLPGPAIDSGRVSPAGTANPARRDSSIGTAQVPTPAGRGATPASTGSSPPNPPARPRVATTTDSGQRAGTPNRLPPLDPAVEATFLKFDETKRTATFQLASGVELEGQVSFNGARRGERVLTIPLGWRLAIEFINRDADLPHSATVVPGVEPLPEQIPPAAFPQAHSVKLEEGLLEGDSDDVSFVAEREGRYFIACGVLGHAQRGQWLVLEISATATRPSYR